MQKDAPDLMASKLKSVLITGCSAGGIGAGIAEAFQERGYHVFATARNTSKISPTLAQAPNVTVLALDVLSADAIAAAVQSVAGATAGTLDVLVNNSGTIMVMPALDLSIDAAKRVFDTNYWAYLEMIRAFAPLLIKAKGYVVNNTSISGVAPFGAFSSIYNSSKAAAINGSESWRAELAPLGVRTLTLVTGGVKSNAFNNIGSIELPPNTYYAGVQQYIRDVTDGRMQDGGIQPKQCGLDIVKQVEKGKTGKHWVGGGATSARYALWLMPGWALDWLLASMFPWPKMLHSKKD